MIIESHLSFIGDSKFSLTRIDDNDMCEFGIIIQDKVNITIDLSAEQLGILMMLINTTIMNKVHRNAI